MHLVDLASEEELPDGGDAAPDANIFAVCRFGRLLKGGVDSCGDKVKRGAAFHLERRPGVMGEHVDGRVVGRIWTPPALPDFSRREVGNPGTPDRAEHVAA